MNLQGVLVPQTLLARENLAAQAELPPLVLPQLLWQCLGPAQVFGTMHSWAVSTPHVSGALGKASSWESCREHGLCIWDSALIREGQVRVRASGAASQAQLPSRCPQQDRLLCKASTSLGNKCPQSPGHAAPETSPPESLR